MVLRPPFVAFVLALVVLTPGVTPSPQPSLETLAPSGALAAWAALAGEVGVPGVALATAALDAVEGDDMRAARVGQRFVPPAPGAFAALAHVTTLQHPSAATRALPALATFQDVPTAMLAAYAAAGIAPPPDAHARLSALDASLDPTGRRAITRVVAAFVLELEVARLAFVGHVPDTELLAAARIAVSREVLDAASALAGIVPSPCPPEVANLCARAYEDCGYFLIDLRPGGATHTCHYALSIDVFGDDIYVNNAGGASADSLDDQHRRFLGTMLENEFHCINTGVCYPTPLFLGCYRLEGDCKVPAALFVDVQGNDRYVPMVTASRDPPLPPHRPHNPTLPFTDTNGDLIALNGAGWQGIGALFDLAGDDVYDARVTLDREDVAINGAAVEGSGLLVDLGGNDLYAGSAPRGDVNGVGGFAGIGMLLDACGDDVYAANGSLVTANGAASGGAGALVDLCGDDVYEARGDRGWANGAANIGSGLLIDLDGDDLYNATLGNGVVNGAGDLAGVGILIDLLGADVYEASLGTGLANGAGRTGAGLLVDAAGDNTFRATVVRGGANGVALGSSQVLVAETLQSLTRSENTGQAPLAGGIGVLLAGPGDDTYVANGVSHGAASLYGAGFLVDAGGRNVYDGAAAVAPSHAGGCVARYEPASGNVSLGRVVLPHGRTDAAAAWDGTRAWLVGGRDATTIDAAHAYTPGNDTATSVSDLPEPRFGAGAFYNAGHVYVVGGRMPPPTGQVFTVPNLNTPTAIARINTTTGETVALPDAFAVGRYHAAMAWSGSTAYVFGGILSNGSIVNETVQYTPGSAPVVLPAKLPARLAAASAVWTGTHAFLFGGEHALSGPTSYTNQVLRFDPASGTYVMMSAKLPTPRHSTAAVYDGLRYAYVVGGRDVSGALDEVVRYDTWTDATSLLARIPTPRIAPAAVWTGSEVLVLGGGEECLRGFSQGAGHAGSAGVLVDLGENATFILRPHVRGQGSGSQGVGILLHTPPDPLAAGALYVAHAGSAPFKVSGAGIGLRLDTSISTIAGPPVLQECSNDTVEPVILRDTVSYESPFGAEDWRVYVCDVDRSTQEPLLDPASGRATGDLDKPPCSSLPACSEAATALPLLPSQREWLEANHASATVSGGLSFLDIRVVLPAGEDLTHVRRAVFVQSEVDHMCGAAGCASTT